jgi:hypothetical protein
MDELQLLQERRPTTTDPTPHVVGVQRARLIDVVNTEQGALVSGMHHAPRVRRRSRRAALGSAATIAAAIVASVVVGFGHGTNPAQTRAASALGSLARTASVQPLPGHGDVVHTEVQADYGSGFEDVQKWVAPDGSQRMTIAGGGSSAADADRHPFSLHHAYPDWHDWPTTADGVLARLRSEAAATDMRPVDFAAFQGAADALRASAAPTAIRAAFFEAVAQLDGVESLGTVSDHSGRTGLGFEMQSDASHHTQLELIFDPATAELIAENSSDTDGSNATWADYVVAEFVDAIPPRAVVVPPDPCTRQGC